MDNSYEQQAIDLVKQNEALKAQVNYLLEQVYTDEASMDGPQKIESMTPEQCLNSVKADAINDFINKVADIELKGSKGSNKAEYYKAALRNVFLLGKHVIIKLRANN